MPCSNKWPPHAIERSQNNLNDLYGVISNLRESNLTLSPSIEDAVNELSKLLVIRSCGHIETVFSCCFLEYTKRHAASTVADYLENTYRKWQSPKPENLKDTLKKLSPKLSNRFCQFLDDNGGSSDLGSLVNERDKISHGANDRVTVSLSERYYKLTLNITQWLIEEFSPNGNADQCS